MALAAFLVCLLSLLSLALSIGDDEHRIIAAEHTCSNIIVNLLEKHFHVSSLQGITVKLLENVQDKCISNECPRFAVASTCQNQSIDDINCEMKDVFNTSKKLGTDTICNVGCDSWPCKAGCNGINTGICFGADWVLCKAGCLGISSCVNSCEHAIVDPCKKTLIHECSEACEDTFQKCKAACKSSLTMEISGDFERLQHIITSMSVSTLDVNCSGNGVTSGMDFQAEAGLHINNAALELKLHVSDAGISTVNTVYVQKIKMTLAAPFTGYLDCRPFVPENVTVKVGQPALTNFSLDVDVQLDKTLDSIADVVCAGLSFCKQDIKQEISSTIKQNILKEVPPKVVSQLKPILEKLASDLRCPKVLVETEANQSLVV